MVANRRGAYRFGRFLAPAALIAVAVAVVLIVRARVDSHHPVTAPRAHQASSTSHHAAAKPKFYVIKPGDSLSTISVKTGISIAELQKLNPSIDPAALQSGERLRLSP